MISVIVPVYNVEKYLEKCVNSILCQSYQNFEIILVDDGSTDSSGVQCDKFQSIDDRIKVIHQKNAGLSAARNRGTKEAKGEYIAFIDSDDWILSDYLEVLYTNLINSQAQVSVCGYQMIWDDTEKTDRLLSSGDSGVIVYSGREATEQIVNYHKRFMITAWGKLYHKSVFELLHYPEGKAHEDEFVTYKVFYESQKVAVTTKALYMYMQRGGSIMQKYSEKRLDGLSALMEAIQYFEKKSDSDMYIFAVKRYMLNIQISWYRVKRFLPERKDILCSLRKDWIKWYNEYKHNILQSATLVEKITLYTFLCSPVLYCIIAGIYNRLFPDA